jgi:hypothetical protein
MCASSPAPATGCATRCPIATSAATHAATTRARNRSGILLQLTGQDWNLNLRATNHPEFDAWRWNDYWVPLDVVVEFKRGVYEMALTELARYLPRQDFRNRFLRSKSGGAVNAFYEGVRCSTSEAKTYARYSGGAWQDVEKPEWKRFYDLNSRYTKALSEQGLCRGNAPRASVGDMLKNIEDPVRKVQ